MRLNKHGCRNLFHMFRKSTNFGKSYSICILFKAVSKNGAIETRRNRRKTQKKKKSTKLRLVESSNESNVDF